MPGPKRRTETGSDPPPWRPAVVALITPEGGQGVLVEGRLIVTAAHCVTCESVAGAALGDRKLLPVETSTGRRFRVAVMFMDPFADIAVLAPPDDQVFPREADAFERFADETIGLPVRRWEASAEDSIPVHVHAHTGELIPGAARVIDRAHWTVWLETEQPIRGGTSGGPIVSLDGDLLAVVSQAGGVSDPDAGDDEDGGTEGVHPSPARALPVWAFERIAKTAKGKTSAKKLKGKKA